MINFLINYASTISNQNLLEAKEVLEWVLKKAKTAKQRIESLNILACLEKRRGDF